MRTTNFSYFLQVVLSLSSNRLSHLSAKGTAAGHTDFKPCIRQSSGCEFQECLVQNEKLFVWGTVLFRSKTISRFDEKCGRNRRSHLVEKCIDRQIKRWGEDWSKGDGGLGIEYVNDTIEGLYGTYVLSLKREHKSGGRIFNKQSPPSTLERKTNWESKIQKNI